MSFPEPSIRVRVDVSNPGQFFACCGLLELADRIWPGAECWFDKKSNFFCLVCSQKNPTKASIQFINSLAEVKITNTMTEPQIERRLELKKNRKLGKSEDEKKELDKLWRESPILFTDPFNIRLDWYLDDSTGGSAFKTWAGQQSVIDILTAMRAPIERERIRFSDLNPELWFFESIENAGVPFYFDSNLGRYGSDLDVGFSLDPLGMSSTIRPLIEILAFVGLQRFRPAIGRIRNEYRFFIWTIPLCVQIAAAACCGHITIDGLEQYQFSLLFRTKYLKSFLPASYPKA